ncbi:MAG: PAS domain-containing protein [bacterium]|nr:PAS domain-containing protein [bacterium]
MPSSTASRLIRSMLPTLGLVLLLALMNIFLVTPAVLRIATVREEESLESVSRAALRLLEHYQHLEEDGVPREEAMRRAEEALRDLRYGPDDAGYFWIQTIEPRLLMHPLRPELEGAKPNHDPETLFLTRSAAAVRPSGGGFVEYPWRADAQHESAPKLSYVHEFQPWGWIIGTGVFLSDIHADVKSLRDRISLLLGAIVFAGLTITAYQGWRLFTKQRDLDASDRSLGLSEERFRVLFDSAPMPVSLKGTDGLYVLVNPAFADLARRPASEIVGRSSQEIWGAEVAAILDKGEDEALAGELVEDEEGIEIEGVRLEFRTMKIPMCLDTGEVIGLCSIAVDITERIRAREQARLRQEQLIQADKTASMGILVSGVSHEINNPNHFIMSNASLLLDVWEGARPILDVYREDNGEFLLAGMKYSRLREELPQVVGSILTGSERIRDIIGELKAYARREPVGSRELLHVNLLVKSAATLAANLVKKHTHHFSVSHEESLPCVRGNLQQLEHALINLIQNALESLPDKDCAVRVRTRYDVDQERVILEVEDEGGGIPSDQLGHLSDPFFTTRREEGSRGLGLWVCARIVHDHGGTLEFDSTPGKGTVACIALPVGKEHDEASDPGMTVPDNL